MLEKPVSSVTLSHYIPHVFGKDAWRWHPKTMEEELEQTFGFVDKDNITKVHALQVLFVSDSPKDDWMAFEKIVQGLIGNEVMFKIMQRPTLQQLFLAADIIKEIDPDFFTECGDEVSSYVAAVFADEEVPWVPPPLSEIKEVQDKVEEATGLDYEPFEADYRGPQNEPASKLILQSYNVVVSDRSNRQQELG